MIIMELDAAKEVLILISIFDILFDHAKLSPLKTSQHAFSSSSNWQLRD